MERPQTHYVSFADQQVGIVSEHVDVIAPFLRSFAPLLTTEPSDVIATLHVVKDGEGYRVEGARQFEGQEESPRGVLQFLKFEVIHRFVDEHPELIWLHAGATASGGKAILLSGAWGSGKSTTIGNLCRKGWSYLSDDIVPIELSTNRLIAFPLTPMMRSHDASAAGVVLSPEEISDLDREVVVLEPEAYSTEAAKLSAIVFPRYDPEVPAVELIKMAPGQATLVLLQNCLDLKSHQNNAVQYLGGLVAATPVFELRYNDGEAAADVLIEAHGRDYT